MSKEDEATKAANKKLEQFALEFKFPPKPIQSPRRRKH